MRDEVKGEGGNRGREGEGCSAVQCSAVRVTHQYVECVAGVMACVTCGHKMQSDHCTQIEGIKLQGRLVRQEGAVLNSKVAQKNRGEGQVAEAARQPVAESRKRASSDEQRPSSQQEAAPAPCNDTYWSVVFFRGRGC